MLALGIAFATAVVLYGLRQASARRLAAWARRTDTVLDDILADLVAHTHPLFLLALGCYLAAGTLDLPPRPERLLNSIIITAVLLQAALWGNRAIAQWVSRSLRRPHAADAAGATTVRIAGFVTRLSLWTVLTLMVLDNLGVNITALVASLGIGGVAVALALQNILGDLFASLSIALDKPFEIGDFIVVGDYLGTVEYVGLKTTRLRALSGEQIIISNADLLQSRVRNHKRMQERRVPFQFGVVYQTSVDTLARIPAMVRAIVEQQPTARFDRAHLKEFGDSALVFECVYYVQDPDYNTFMDVHQAIALALLRSLRTEAIELAYPTQTLHIANAGGDSPVETP